MRKQLGGLRPIRGLVWSNVSNGILACADGRALRVGTAEPAAVLPFELLRVGWSPHPFVSPHRRTTTFFYSPPPPHSVFVSPKLAEMTTTTTFQGMDPGSKSSSRVLRPPGGETSLSFGSEESSPRKNKMVSNIFAEPDDPHANRRTEPPTGPATGTLCGEPSAPLRRCQQPILFPKNPQPELTTIHNSGAALVWRQRQQENGQINDNPDEVEGEQDEQEQPNQQKELPQPSDPSGGASAGGRRNPLEASPASSWVKANLFHSNAFLFLKISPTSLSLSHSSPLPTSTCAFLTPDLSF
uniref:Jupiter microtubule associated homolog 1b n=1 Tax=Neogobius melanostomus TaxID=47308 RepID=A0A8C6U5Z4_9GOBI